MNLKENDIIQRAELYLVRDSKARHIVSWDVFVKMCKDLGLDTESRHYLGEKDMPPIGKPITEWPEPEKPEQRKISILWMGDEKWLDEFGGTHIVNFHEPCRPDWYPPSKLKLISYLKMDSFDDNKLKARVEEAKNHPNNGGYWLISGHEPDITGKIDGSVEKHKQRRIEQYNIIRAEDPDSWNHPVVTFFDVTSSDFQDYPGWEGAFTGEDHDIFVIDCYANKKDGTVDYPGMEQGAKLVEIGLSRSKGQFIPNLGACYTDGEKPASLVDQWEWWQKRFGPLEGVCFWNSGIGSWAIGVYEDDNLAEETKEINRRLGLS